MKLTKKQAAAFKEFVWHSKQAAYWLESAKTWRAWHSHHQDPMERLCMRRSALLWRSEVLRGINIRKPLIELDQKLEAVKVEIDRCKLKQAA